MISWPTDNFITSYTVLTRPNNKVETAVNGCNSWLSVWTLSCRSISLASLFSSLSTIGWSDLLQIPRKPAEFSFAILRIIVGVFICTNPLFPLPPVSLHLSFRRLFTQIGRYLFQTEVIDKLWLHEGYRIIPSNLKMLAKFGLCSNLLAKISWVLACSCSQKFCKCSHVRIFGYAVEIPCRVVYV